MRIKFKNNIASRVNEITGKSLKNIKIIKDEEVLAELNESKDIKEGIHSVSVLIEYKDGSSDILDKQKIYIYTNDVNLTINYASFGNLMSSMKHSPLFWIGVVSTFFMGLGILVLGVASIFIDRSIYYKKNGSSIMKLSEK